MRTAFVIDLLVQRGGAEYVLEVLARHYPEADIFTLLYLPDRTFRYFRTRKVTESSLASFPVIGRLFRRAHKAFLPFYPLAFESFDFSGYDAVVSISFLGAKNIVTPRGTAHLSYCLTPARYIWDMAPEYLSSAAPRAARPALAITMHYLRMWDELRTRNVDRFVAISDCVRRRIQKRYGRDAEVLFPPYDSKVFRPDLRERREDYYIASSRHVAYKKLGLAVDAFNRSGRRLVITGSGPETFRLRKAAAKNISFTGYIAAEELAILFRRARALVFPGEEDFGIAIVNALACGTPVIAYGRGSALELVRPGINGLLFYEQSAESLNEAVVRFEALHHEPAVISASVSGLDEKTFCARFDSLLGAMVGS